VQVVVLLCSLSQSRGKQARVWVGLDCQNQLCVEREHIVQEEFRGIGHAGKYHCGSVLAYRDKILQKKIKQAL